VLSQIGRALAMYDGSSVVRLKTMGKILDDFESILSLLMNLFFSLSIHHENDLIIINLYENFYSLFTYL
jgi:hypothetical protein